MRPSNNSDERGSAPLEFLVAGLVLLVPIVYLVVALAAVQNTALGTEATARFVARTLASGDVVPPELVRDTVADAYGLDPESLELSIACVPSSTDCPAAGSIVAVTVSDTVQLPLAPEVFGIADALSIPIDATSTYRVARLSEGS